MATANGVSTQYTLRDIMAAQDPTGKIAAVSEILMQTNPILDDIPWRPTIKEESELVTIRKTLGDPQWARHNEYVGSSTSKTSQFEELCGHVEDWSIIAASLADRAGDLNAYLALESKGKIEGMGQAVVEKMMYGTLSTDESTFLGLAPRLNALNDTYMDGSPVVLNAGGVSSSANASIILVGWGETTVHGIYPRNSSAGLKFENLGKGLSEKTDGGVQKFLEVYRSHFSWDCGLAVRDYRNIVRIANIDVAALDTIGSSSDTAAQLYLLFQKALSYIPNPDSVNLCAYCPRAVWVALNQQAMLTGNRAVNVGIQDSPTVTRVMGVPVRRLDKMLTTEAVVA